MTLKEFNDTKNYYWGEWHFYTNIAIDYEYADPIKAQDYRKMADLYFLKWKRMDTFEKKLLTDSLKSVDKSRF